jgi:ABC-type multidrug transport system ATPase subunit
VVRKLVRQLSLGERMKVELAGALLHQPRVLFLDEPIIGLDVAMQRRIRSFIAEYNRRHHATILLSSHYMADVQALCRRVIVIHHGAILFDGELRALSDQFTSHKTITVTLEDPSAALDGYGEIVDRDGNRVTIRVGKEVTLLVAAFCVVRVRPHRAQCIVLVQRGDAEDAHDRVADVLLDRAPVTLESVSRPVEEAGQHAAEELGIEPLAEAGRVNDIGEEHGDCPARFPRFGHRAGQLVPTGGAETRLPGVITATAWTYSHDRSVRNE